MNYLQDAFDGFNPQVDRDGAVKLALSIIFMDERLHELSCLLTDGHEIGGLEGEPGWIIERRDTGPSGNHLSYANWPKNTHFHAHVNPESFELGYPDAFMEVCNFYDYVGKALDVYLTNNPAKQHAVGEIVFQLKNLSSD